MKHIGSGQARDVYALDQGRVVKVAKGVIGVDCNRREWRIWNSAVNIKHILVPCIDISEDGKRLIQKRGKRVNEVPPYPDVIKKCNVNRPKQWVEIDGRVKLADYGCPRLDKKPL